MARLFDEAAIVSARLGSMLTHPDGASIAQCKDALDKGEQTLGIGQLEAGVFEAHAAAAAYGAFTRDCKRFIMVVDMGAGTTDIAAFERLEDGPEPLLTELVGARQSCGLAGDEIDQIVCNLLAVKSKVRERAAQATLWRTLLLSARGLKRDLFTTGKCAFQHEGKTLRLRLRDLAGATRFKEFTHALASTCEASLNAVFARADDARGDGVTIVLAGGGANLPFLGPLVSQGAAKLGRTVTCTCFGADGALPADHGAKLGDAFPQVAISLGGAVAHLTDELAPARAPV
jgi:molecular chaperone DnaK (HSP70)